MRKKIVGNAFNQISQSVSQLAVRHRTTSSFLEIV